MLVLLLVIASTLPFSGAEWFTSFSHVLSLLQEESKLLGHLNDYIELEYAKLEYLENAYNEISESSCNNARHPRQCMENPTNQFATMKRLAQTWTDIAAVAANKSASERFIWALERSLPNLPRSEDILGSIHGLIRVQAAYGYPVGEISRGIVGQSVDGKSLTAADCFAIGEVAYSTQDHLRCIDWSVEAKDKIYQGDRSVSLERVLYLLARCSYGRDNLPFAYETMKEVVRIAPDFMEVADFYRHVVQEANKRNIVPFRGDFASILRRNMEDRPPTKIGVFEELCQRSSYYVNPNAGKLLYCYMWDGNRNPRLLLQPIRVEVESERPFLARLYDLVTDRESEQIKKAALPLLKRAKVVGTEGKPIESEYRVTKTVFLEDNHNVAVARVNRRIGDVTGFDTRFAEPVSVSNYGIGGHYNVHVDPFGDSKLERADMGDRIATVLIYLSDVSQGGNTIFTNAGIAVQPIKGSGVLWYNLFTNGTVDLKTLHAGCPVATGEKWIINKWIRERAVSTCQPCKSQTCPEQRHWMQFDRR